MRVQFFSQLKEIVGASEITLDLPDGTSVADLLARLYRDFPELEKWDRGLLVGAGSCSSPSSPRHAGTRSGRSSADRIGQDLPD
jgi:molybdopterin converting factor small subunit